MRHAPLPVARGHRDGSFTGAGSIEVGLHREIVERPRVGIRWYAPGGLVKVAEELRELEFGERMPLAAAP